MTDQPENEPMHLLVESKEQSLYNYALAQIDKANHYMMALATGALSLSITFKQNIIPEQPESLWMLKLSWVLFLVCILSTIIGRWLEASYIMQLLSKRDSKSDAYVLVPGFLSSFGFVGGLIAMATFVMLNMD